MRAAPSQNAPSRNTPSPSPRSRHALPLYAAAGSLVLTALVATPGRADPAPPPDSAALRGTAVAAARAAATGIRFGPCAAAEQLPKYVKCGTVSVPLDYAHPAGKQIRLTVSRVKATGMTAPEDGKPVARQGALVFNPGGPGGSGMYFPLVGLMPEWKRIASAYDLVGYAPRGVGRSAPLSCEDPKRFGKGPTQAPTRPSAAYKTERIARAKAYAQRCAKSAGDALRQYTTLNNARDLDVLRAALGEPKLNFMGASYGTYFGAVYATLFPTHVRRMVFDAAVNPDPKQIWYADNLAQSAAFERRWADFRHWVAEHDGTYHLGATADEVRRSYEKVRARLAREPAGGTVGPGELQAAYLQVGYYDDYWAMRASALSAYLKGDPKPLVEQAAPQPAGAVESENAAAVYTAVECNDAAWPTDFRVWDRDNTALARTAPFGTWTNAWMNLPCAYWPAPRMRPVDVRTAPGALPPTLILAAERDAAAPYEGARELWRRLAGSALVTERGAGNHGIAGGPNECVNGHLDAYLMEGRVPAAQAFCAPHPEPTPLATG
ncbi:alpha/beta hydrolase [Streptomyces sp. NPDC046821]|uniref:alpha/beta hydrolase n=1 Tax=Streptomyces sp. NPDC046821 TaxID=3154702 RepID=UPI0033CAB16E